MRKQRRRGKAEPSGEAAINTWKRLFGEGFGKSSSGGGSVSKSSSTSVSKSADYVAPGIPVARRPKEARRFG